MQITFMKRLILFVPVLALLALSSCVTPPTPEEMKQAHYGSYPSNYRSQIDTITDDFHERLGDPFQVISVSKPQKDWMGDAGNRIWGYSVELRYQGPNPSVNAPTYLYRAKVFFRNKKVVSVTDVTNFGDVLGSSLINNLNSLNQQPNGDDGSQQQGSGQ
jgi:hypothetical protein